MDTPTETRVRAYFEVPGHYGYDFEGKRDATFEDALARARTQVKPHGRGLEGFTRAFVDERGTFDVSAPVKGRSDRVVRRWEVFSDGTYVEMGVR